MNIDQLPSPTCTTFYGKQEPVYGDHRKLPKSRLTVLV